MTSRKPSGKRSDEYSWDLDRPEQAQDLIKLYDVRGAKHFISKNPRAIELLNLARYKELFEEQLSYTKLRDNIDWDTVDTELPTIFGQNDEGKIFLIDGNHRVAKALRSGLEWLPVIFLTSEETARVRIV